MMYCELKVFLPFHIHLLEVLVEAKLITFSNTPFKLTDVFFEGPLYTI